MPPELTASPAATPCAAGIDLGTSGLRLALVDAGGALLLEESSDYPLPFDHPEGWRLGISALLQRVPPTLRQRIGALAVDGTSGTLLLCQPDGRLAAPDLAGGALSRALPYHQACPEQELHAQQLAGGGPAASASGSLARALRLLTLAERGDASGPWWLRHQADWITGWLLQDWRWGEEGNNLRLGWNLQQQRWSGRIDQQPWSAGLPAIATSGSSLGAVAGHVAEALGLPAHCQVVAGSTDANAAVLAAEPADGDGVTVLGTTLVLKQWSPRPIEGPGVSCHRVGGRWLVGGASNAGGGVLRQFFDDGQIAELSRQIDPSRSSGLELRPLPGRGERFPVDDPLLEPVLSPRPVSDSRYLQALLEGLARVEQQGWQRLEELGAPPVQRVITLGGGARNPQWRAIRQRLLQRPVLNRPGRSAAQGMARLAASALPAR